MENRKKTGSALVLLSGGQDSTTCLFLARKKYKSVYALSFDYSQKNNIELKYARSICDDYMIPHDIISLPLLNTFRQNNIYSDSGEKVHKNYIFGRNLFFISFAAIYAIKKGIHNIIIGISQNDVNYYPDCCDAFVKSINETINIAMDYSFNVSAPLINKDKKSIWLLSDELGIVDIIKNKTVTCYNGIVGNGCGCCQACLSKNKGYIEYIKTKWGIKND